MIISMFDRYDVPVGGGIIPPPTFLVNGRERVQPWVVMCVVDRTFQPYSNHHAMSSVLGLDLP